MDFLQVAASERVDVDDFQYAVSMSQINASRIATANILTSGGNFVVNGFRATNPSGTKTISVTCGTAILSWRQGAVIVHGMTMAPPDGTGGTSQQLSQTQDVSTYVAGTYTVWIRFNFTDAAIQGRTFWQNNTVGGKEYSQSSPTRTQAVWEMRIDANNPGSEWLAIASVVVGSGGAVTSVTDTRPLFYEGSGASPTYISTWGTGANDRSADRATYPTPDLKTFVDQVHTCLEDIKGGAGYARWYDPYANRIRVGDASFYLQGVNTAQGYSNPAIYFDGLNTGTGYLVYARTSKLLAYNVAGVNCWNINALGQTYIYGTTSAANPYSLCVSPANTGVYSRVGFLNAADTLSPMYMDIGGSQATPSLTISVQGSNFYLVVPGSATTPIYYSGSGSSATDQLTLSASIVAINTYPVSASSGAAPLNAGLQLNRYGQLVGRASASNRQVQWNADQIVLSAATVTKNNGSFYNPIGTGYPYQSTWTSQGTLNGVAGMYSCRVCLTGTSIPANAIVSVAMQPTASTVGSVQFYGAVVPSVAGANYIDFYFSGLVVFSYTVLAAGAYL